MPSQVIESRGRLITLPVRPNAKGPRGLYPLADPEEQAIEDKYNSITKPLTLLSDFGDQKPEIVVTSKDGRPTTPVQKAVTFIPTKLDDLNNVIRKRICPNEILPLSVADQQCLAAIILGEISNQWEDLKKMPENPLLNKSENVELVRRCFVHVVSVCEELFFHYNAKLELLNKSGVFTGPANIARLRGQLALDADKFLNVGYIRRRIAREILGNVTGSDVQVAGQGPKLHLTQDELFDKSRPHKIKTIITVAQREIKDMMKKMPADLDMEAVTDLIPKKAMEMGVHHGGHVIPAGGAMSERDKQLQKERGKLRGDGMNGANNGVKLTRSRSHETIRWDADKFEDEIGEFRPKPLLIDVHEDAMYDLRREALPKDRIYTPPKSPSRKLKSTPEVTEIDQEFIRKDLEERSKYVPLKDLNENLPEEEELPPLLQASSKYNHVEGRLEALQKKLADLEQAERDELERQRKELYESASSSEPRHPQPAVISTKLPNFMVVRTNDVRVSDRVSLNSLTLKSYPPIFDHLNNEVDHATVRKLDAPLFYDAEINELYDELLSSAPGDHLNMELDPEVETAGSGMKLSDCSSSRSLFKNPSERVVNKDLQVISEDMEPPWAGVGDMEDWMKIADGSLKGSHDILMKTLRNKDAGGVELSGESSKDPTARNALGDWVVWWKSQVDHQDYLRFLAASESDYMALLFHLYRDEDELAASMKGDSDSEDEYLKNPNDSVLQMLPPKSREKNAKLIEAVREKERYSEGFWNARSVSIGGLGKLPSQKEVEESVSGQQMLSEEGTKDSKASGGSEWGHKSELSDQKPVVHKLTLALLEGKDRTDMLKEQRNERQKRKAAGASLQERLEKVWNDLRVPDQMRLDMALKYSGEPWVSQISSAIAGWEKCAALILIREQILTKLELFETHASNPDRFFRKGYDGSSKMRIKESKLRQEFDASLKKVDVKIKKHCEYIEKTFNDVVSYQGRPYVQKIKFDRTEMLYWLQQERREKGLEREINAQKFPINGLNGSGDRPLSSSRKKMASPIILEPLN